eukprot:11524825-Alexandrium_andersonii.AAC.1
MGITIPSHLMTMGGYSEAQTGVRGLELTWKEQRRRREAAAAAAAAAAPAVSLTELRHKLEKKGGAPPRTKAWKAKDVDPAAVAVPSETRADPVSSEVAVPAEAVAVASGADRDAGGDVGTTGTAELPENLNASWDVGVGGSGKTWADSTLESSQTSEAEESDKAESFASARENVEEGDADMDGNAGHNDAFRVDVAGNTARDADMGTGGTSPIEEEERPVEESEASVRSLHDSEEGEEGSEDDEDSERTSSSD